MEIIVDNGKTAKILLSISSRQTLEKREIQKEFYRLWTLLTTRDS
jgi:hypothetical protein